MLFKNICKFVSRILYSRKSPYHLSSWTFTDPVDLPTPRHWTSSPYASVYVAFQPMRFTRLLRSPGIPVGSYPTFSPLPLARRFPFLRHFLSDPPFVGSAFLLGSMVLYVVRTFLHTKGMAIRPLANAVQMYSLITRFLPR